jgi:hypothetical protein
LSTRGGDRGCAPGPAFPEEHGSSDPFQKYSDCAQDLSVGLD